MPSSDINGRSYVKNASGVWTPVGFGATDAKMPTLIEHEVTGQAAAVSPFGDLSVAQHPTPLLTESFENATIDTADRWTTAGSITAACILGQAQIEPGAGANATTTLTSQATFQLVTQTFVAALLTFESGSIVTGNHRFFGLGTPPSPPGTAAAPLQDAVGFEVDITGTLRASMYASGTRIFTQPMTIPTDGQPHLYVLNLRGDNAFFSFDDFDVPSAYTRLGPTHQVLPLRIASLNSATVSGAPTLECNGVAVLDGARTATAIADGTNGWRKAKVDAAGALQTTLRPATLAVTMTGSGAQTLTVPAAGPGLFHYINSVTITRYATGTLTANSAPLTVTTTNLPGSIAWTLDTAGATGQTVTSQNDYTAPLKSSAANTATTIVCPSFANALWRVTVTYFAAP